MPMYGQLIVDCVIALSYKYIGTTIACNIVGAMCGAHRSIIEN